VLDARLRRCSRRRHERCQRLIFKDARCRAFAAFAERCGYLLRLRFAMPAQQLLSLLESRHYAIDCHFR